jgi:hypothetical protein
MLGRRHSGAALIAETIAASRGLYIASVPMMSLDEGQACGPIVSRHDSLKRHSECTAKR